MAHRGAGEIRADVTVTGDAVGQLARGRNTLRMRVDRVRGNAVTVRPAAAAGVVLRWVRFPPGPRGPVFGRDDEVEQALAELTAYGSVALQAPPGMGATTVLRHLAHHPALAAAYGGVVCLSARDLSRDDLLQALFTTFCTTDVPMRPTLEQLRELLRPARAAVLLDDVELSAADLAELQYLLPNCGFVFAGRNVGGVMRSVKLDGLTVDAAGELLAHVLGEPVERSVVYALWGLTRGAPAALIQLGLSASTHPTAEFVASALDEGPPPFAVDSPQDRRLLGLLGAVPGVELSAEQLAAASGVPDVTERLRRWVGCGLVTASATRTYRFAGGALDPTEWGLPQRRAELVAAFATWARRHPNAELVAGGTAEPFRMLQEVARQEQSWRAVLAIGAVLDGAYAAAGRWDAWHSCLLATLEAARAIGDQAAEAMALHQLGTGALGRGDLEAAYDLLSGALGIRVALGHTAAAAVTRQNLATITAAPASRRFAVALGRVPTPVKAVAVLLPLLGSLAFVGLAQAGSTPAARLDPQQLAFVDQVVDKASAPQVFRLTNDGPATLHVDNVAVGGANHGAFTLVDTSCVGEVPKGGGCTATVLFTPATPGEQRASLSWQIREIPGGLTAPIVGTGVAAPPPPVPVAVNPSVLAFNAQTQGTPSAPQQVRVVAGSTPLALKAAAAQGDFRVDGDGCAGIVLAPSTECLVAVRFTPSAVGERTSQLTVADADGRPAASVSLRGTGSAVPQPDLAVTPAALGFGDQTVGTTSAARRVTLTNRGNASMDLGALTLSGARGFAVSDNCPAALGPGKVCTATVTFSPSSAGPRSAQLRTGTVSVGLRGAGVAPAPPPAPQLVLVPGLTGDQLADAQRAIEAAGLKVGAVTRRAGSEAEGTVVGQTPASGANVERGGSVDLVVSSGVVQVAVPSLVGKSLDAARAAISDAKLAVGQVTEKPSDTVAEGVVISSSPGAGAQVAPGARVGLVVSSGPAPVVQPVPEPVVVPGVAGRPLASARAMITDANLVVGQVKTQPSDSVAESAVISSSPGGGAKVAAGSRVGLVVSSGPAEVAAPVVPKPVVPKPVTPPEPAAPEPAAQEPVAPQEPVPVQKPAAQKAPQVQKVPEVPKAPVVPKAPAVQKAPEAKKAPVVPKAPVTSKEPVTPKEPAVQEAPATQKAPAASKKPAASKVPAVEVAAVTPNVVGMTVGQATAALQQAGLRAAVIDTDGNPATSGTVVAASVPKNKRVTLTVQASSA